MIAHHPSLKITVTLSSLITPIIQIKVQPNKKRKLGNYELPFNPMNPASPNSATQNTKAKTLKYEYIAIRIIIAHHPNQLKTTVR